MTFKPPAADPPAQALNVVLGGHGGLGQAFVRALAQRGERVLALGRTSKPALDYTRAQSVADCALHVAEQLQASGAYLSRLIVATGVLHGQLPDGRTFGPERGWQHLDADVLAHVMTINATGPALVMRHVLPLLPRQGRVVAAFVSARVGSIGDNALGGWYAYRSSKAALNQLVRTASVELARRNRDALCVALHPGTVDTPLSQPFARQGLNVRPPDVAAHELLRVMDTLPGGSSGLFFDQHGQQVAW